VLGRDAAGQSLLCHGHFPLLREDLLSGRTL
jgi:hypothetical protein